MTSQSYCVLFSLQSPPVPYTHTRIHTHIHTHRRTHIHTHTHAYTHTHTYTHIHAHRRTHTHECLSCSVIVPTVCFEERCRCLWLAYTLITCLGVQHQS